MLRQSFVSYFIQENARFVGASFLKHQYYGIKMSADGNLYIYKNTGAKNTALIVLANELETALAMLKRDFLNNNSFVYNKIKCQSVNGILSIINK